MQFSLAASFLAPLSIFSLYLNPLQPPSSPSKEINPFAAHLYLVLSVARPRQPLILLINSITIQTLEWKLPHSRIVDNPPQSKKTLSIRFSKQYRNHGQVSALTLSIC